MTKVPYRYSNCRVDRIIDGDTVDLWINLGFSTYVKKRIRLYGINAPERRPRDLEEKARGIEAKQRLAELLSEGQATTVKCAQHDWRVDLDSHELGKYGRVLGTLWVKDVDINRQLVIEGFASEYWGGKR